ncbi:MAG: DUF433 domain-containing protein [Symploca sp. SIO2G7]|nr:DUF433 domain-containing protein [Symploca sp. SIO2G7]
MTYRQGASGQPVAVISGTGIRVQTIAIAAYRWGLSPEQLAQEYGLIETQLSDALGFYRMYQTQIDRAIATEEAIELAYCQYLQLKKKDS